MFFQSTGYERQMLGQRMPKYFLVDMVHQGINRLFGVQRREKGDAVLRINNHIVFSPELQPIIKEGPKINKVKSAAPDNPHSINNFLSRASAVFSSKYCHIRAEISPLVGQLINIIFSASGQNVPSIPPIKNQNAFFIKRRINRLRNGKESVFKINKQTADKRQLRVAEMQNCHYSKKRGAYDK